MQSILEFDYDRISRNDRIDTKSNEFKCRNGVVLKLNRVKRSLVKDAANSITPPTVPVVYIEEKDRTEENPGDPGYVAALRMYNSKIGDIGTSVYIIFGTSIKSKPDDVPNLEDDWDVDLHEIGITVPKIGTKARYYAWMKYVAIDDEQEMLSLSLRVMVYSGLVTEEQVQEVEATFRSNEERVSDKRLSSIDEDSD